jgi:hypothetical protein
VTKRGRIDLVQPPGRPRRFNLVDAAILVMATALGFWVIRDSLAGLLTPPMVMEGGRWVKRWWDPVVQLNRAVTVEVVLLSWSVAWTLLQLRHPRPRLRRLTRQPGFVACASSVFVALVCGPMMAAILASSHRSANIPGEDWLLFETWSALVSAQVGVAVAAGWALLALGRQCRPRSGWLDRVGQVFGAIWVVMVPLNLILPLWFLF